MRKNFALLIVAAALTAAFAAPSPSRAGLWGCCGEPRCHMCCIAVETAKVASDGKTATLTAVRYGHNVLRFDARKLKIANPQAEADLIGKEAHLVDSYGKDVPVVVDGKPNFPRGSRLYVHWQ